MNSFNSKTLSIDAISLSLIIGSALASVATYSHLPSPMAIHFDLSGHANGYASREFGAFSIPVVALFVWGLLRFVPGKLSSAAANLGAMQSVALIVTALLVALHFALLRNAMGRPIDMAFVFGIGTSLFMFSAGLVFPRLRRNPWAGIRVPWTYSSEENWARTHRFAGQLLVVGGVVTLASGLISTQLMFGVGIAVLMASSIASIFYSYAIAKTAIK